MKDDTDNVHSKSAECQENAFDAFTREFERYSHSAVIVCFSLKYLFSVIVYILLRSFASSQFSELWMAVVLAYALYGHEMYINSKVKEDLIKSVLEENHDEEKDKTDSKSQLG